MNDRDEFHNEDRAVYFISKSFAFHFTIAKQISLSAGDFEVKKRFRKSKDPIKPSGCTSYDSTIFRLKSRTLNAGKF
jgi:hypothetical protein